LEGGGDVTVQIGTFIALGDSFTEGLDDPRADQPGYLGWADRFAQMLATQQPGLRYANLALRGKRLAQVADEQVPQAVAMAPDLVSLAAGGNDLLGLRSDPDALAQTFDDLVGTLVTAGSRVLIFTGYDPRYPVLRLIRGKVAVYNAHLRAIAAQHGCDLVDLWAMAVLRDPRALSADRLHLTPAAHHLVALRTCEVIGAAVGEDWREPWPAPDGAIAPGRSAWLAARRTDLRWAQAHAAPWVGRRLRGVSSGDGLAPKRPELAPL
jgi:lysophospholipase L1-like esterase